MSPSIRTTPSAPPSRPFRLPRPESDIGGPSYRVKASDPQSKTHKNVHPRAEAPSSKRQPRPRTPSPHHRHMSSGTWVVTKNSAWYARLRAASGAGSSPMSAIWRSCGKARKTHPGRPGRAAGFARMKPTRAGRRYWSSAVCRGKVRFPRGCKPHPATVAPAGSIHDKGVLTSRWKPTSPSASLVIGQDCRLTGSSRPA